MSDDIHEHVVRLRKERRPAALATIVDTKGSTPGKLAQKMIVLPDGGIIGTVGGGCVEADVIRTALTVIDSGLVTKMQFTLAGEEADRTGLACGGRVEVMIEPLYEHHLFIIGCGHVGQKIAHLAKATGFRVTAVDDRPDFANRERLPTVDDVVLADLDDLSGALAVETNGYIIVVTRGHKYDLDGLRWAITTPARFIGVIGSKAKRLRFFKELQAEGVAADRLEPVQIPVGMAIGAETPDEIAVSVVAALVARRRLGT